MAVTVVTAHANQTFTTTTPTIAAAANGNTLVMWIVTQRSPSARTVSSIATTNVTWAKLAGTTNGTIDAEIWFGTVSGGSSGTAVTITMSGTGATVAGVITEFAGVRVKATITDGTAATNTGTSTGPSTASFSTNFLNDLVLSCVGYASGTNPTAQPGAPWTDVTRIANSTVCEVAGEYNLTGSVGSQSATWTIGNVAWVTCVGALKEVNLEYSVSDASTSAEKVQTGIGLFRIGDAVTSAENAKAALGLGQRPADSVASAENTRQAVSPVFRPADSSSVSEKVQTGIGLFNINDAVSVTENLRVVGNTQKLVFDAVSVSDHYVLYFIIDRPVSVSESVTAKFGIVARPGDSVSVSEKVQTGIGLFNISDSISVADLATAVLVAGATLKASVFDTISVSEFVKAVLQLGVRPAEAVAVVEFVDAAVQLGSRPFEAVSVSEFVKAAVQLGVRPAEAVAVTELVKAVINAGARASDSVSLSELAKAVLSPLAVHASDSVSISETVKDVLELGVRPFEAITTSENVAALLNVVRLTLLASESISVVDSAVAVISPILLAVSEAITTLEKIRVGLNLGTRPVDAVSVAETIQALLKTVRITALAAESISVSESVRAIVSPILAAVFDAITVTENVTVTLINKGSIVVDVNDTISVLENIQTLLKTVRITVNASDSVSTSEFTKQPITPLEAALAEAVTVLENVKAAVQLGTRPVDSVSVIENLTAQLPVVRLHISAFEQISVAENVKAVVTPLVAKVLEAISVVEFEAVELHNVRGLLASVSEALAVTEFARALIPALTPSAHENVTVSESVTLLANRLILIADSISVSEFAKLLLIPLAAKLQETSTVTEAVSILVQLLRLHVSLSETITVGEATVQVINTVRGGIRAFDTLSTTEYLNLNIVNSTVIGLYAFQLPQIDASAKLLATQLLPFTLNPVNAAARELATIVVPQ